MKLIITIDTEEDNWGSFVSTDYTTENIQHIPNLHQLFSEYGIKPTYLITFPVATNYNAVSILADILKKYKCEIGMHCHPWNTPPFEEERNEENSMLCNLPVDLQYRKLSFLHDTIIKNFGIEPVSFRAGRFGYSQSVADNLHKLGYKADTSVTPTMNWAGYYGPDYSFSPLDPWWVPCKEIYPTPSKINGALLEVPVTIGYLQHYFGMNNLAYRFLNKRLFKNLRLVGVLDRFRLLNKIMLCPEVTDAMNMIKLAKRMIRGRCEVLNMYFHSTSLKGGLNDFVRNKNDESLFLKRIKDFLSFARNSGIESVTLSSFADHYREKNMPVIKRH